MPWPRLIRPVAMDAIDSTGDANKTLDIESPIQGAGAANCRRHRTLMRAGKPKTVVCAAIARELSGFVWAIATEIGPAKGKKGTGKPATGW